MRKTMGLLLVAATCLALSHAGQASSSLRVKDVVIHQQGDSTNLRVEVFNGGTPLRNQPYQVRLLVRSNPGESFRLLKTWRERNLWTGQKVARDYFSQAGPDDSALHGQHYEVRGEVWANGQMVDSLNRSY